MSEVLVFSRRIVTPDGVVAGAMMVREGHIDAIEPGASAPSGALDWLDDLLIPGLIDIHTDNLEKHFMPRPGTQWDSFGAALAHDAQCAAAGITTVFDSLSLSGAKNGLDRGEALPEMMSGVASARAAGALRAEHRLHLRCEVSNPHLMDLVEQHISNPALSLFSVMDHAPGQRTAGGLEGWRAKLLRQGKTASEIDVHLASMMENRDVAGSTRRRADIAAIARQSSIPLASHDDSSEAHVEEAARLGVTIAEFPVTLEAARHAKRHAMVNVMGAPNFVRGGSHGGNVSARDIAANGLLDALCSDYVPMSMIRAAFQLTLSPFAWDLPQAIDTVAGAPARMCGLRDRGELRPGLRADFLRVRMTDGWPVPVETWREGLRVA
jgi:alpha-D-ribose 1-methylphosphonate 5-triphosphate diphosphatase